MRTRRRTTAREIAMKLLYRQDIWQRIGAEQSADAEPLSADREADPEEFIESATDDPEVRAFARTLYYGALDFAPTADKLVADVVDRWKLERIATLDRAILRLAIFELSELSEVPPKVILNEAIELAKRYSTAQSGAFVNGLLDRLLYLRDGEL